MTKFLKDLQKICKEITEEISKEICEEIPTGIAELTKGITEIILKNVFGGIVRYTPENEIDKTIKRKLT